MGTTHFKSEVNTTTGFSVGAKKVADVDGNLYINGSKITATAADVNTVTGTASQFIVYQVEALTSGTDIATRPLFVCPTGFTFTLSSINIIPQGSASGIDATNTCVIAVNNGANAIATKTYNATTIFPASGVADSLGTLNGTYKVLAAGDILNFSITNSDAVSTPAIVLQIVGELATV